MQSLENISPKTQIQIIDDTQVYDEYNALKASTTLFDENIKKIKQCILCVYDNLNVNNIIFIILLVLYVLFNRNKFFDVKFLIGIATFFYNIYIK